MAKAQKKSAKKASDTFHKIMQASVKNSPMSKQNSKPTINHLKIITSALKSNPFGNVKAGQDVTTTIEGIINNTKLDKETILKTLHSYPDIEFSDPIQTNQTVIIPSKYFD